MKKILKNLKYFLAALQIIVLPVLISFYVPKPPVVQTVLAEDYEEEIVSEREDEKDDSVREEEKEIQTETITTVIEEVPADTQISPAPQIQYVWVPIGAYGTDTDKDGLVDAIDPDPKVPQQMYFTDTDNDSVPDALDQYPGENDFYFVDDTDANNNGILDSLEG